MTDNELKLLRAYIEEKGDTVELPAKIAAHLVGLIDELQERLIASYTRNAELATQRGLDVVRFSRN